MTILLVGLLVVGAVLQEIELVSGEVQQVQRGKIVVMLNRAPEAEAIRAILVTYGREAILVRQLEL